MNLINIFIAITVLISIYIILKMRLRTKQNKIFYAFYDSNDIEELLVNILFVFCICIPFVNLYILIKMHKYIKYNE